MYGDSVKRAGKGMVKAGSEASCSLPHGSSASCKTCS